MRILIYIVILVLNLSKVNFLQSQVTGHDTVKINFDNLDIQFDSQNKKEAISKVFRLTLMHDSFKLFFWDLDKYSTFKKFPIADTLKIKSFLKLRKMLLSASSSRHFNLISDFFIDDNMTSFGRNKLAVTSYGYMDERWKHIGYRNLKRGHKHDKSSIKSFGSFKCIRINSLIKKSIKEGNSLLKLQNN